MKVLNMIVVTVIAVLSIAAGAAKAMQVPEEVQFLQGMGLSLPIIVAFGIVQIAAGILLVLPRTRVPGCIVALIGFALSTVLILISGDLKFAAFSTLPIILAALILLYARGQARERSASNAA